MSRRAMCGRLRVGKEIFHVESVGRCSQVFGLARQLMSAKRPDDWRLRNVAQAHNRTFDCFGYNTSKTSSVRALAESEPLAIAQIRFIQPYFSELVSK
jgi:hypothetical protein